MGSIEALFELEDQVLQLTSVCKIFWRVCKQPHDLASTSTEASVLFPFIMNPFFCLILLFLCFFLCESQLPIPAKIDGFVYRKPTVWGESVVVEAFLDPVCPDSRDSWLPLKQALDYYSGRLSLVVHPFPLP